MNVLRITYSHVAAVSIVLLLSACAATLAPSYDRALFDGITQSNAQIMELLATVSSGTSPATFSEREATYNKLIGRIDALALQSRTRPVPANTVTEKVNKFLESRGMIALSDGAAPSADSLEEVSKNLVKMKETDKKNGLKPGAVATFRNAVVISMDQALTYEAFLER